PPARLPRGPGALPREVVAQAHRRRLLNAMAEAVAENGYVATSIADIVARARVSRSAFYACFADKEACFLAGYSQEADRHFELITAAAAAAGGGWLGRLRAGVREYVIELERHPRFARSFLIEILAAGPQANELRTAVHERYAALMKEWYSEAPDALKLTPLPDEIFRAAVGATNELVIARLERLAAARGAGAHERPLEELVLQSLLGLFGLNTVARTVID
ncbi:MAG TPA: TetR/AcrR family transcriptional regulator, partial [Solirubrobacteraceae bacterium]|nr:TetR/AcrR family transcriptional regulator [Solirubrobacteraceae bacterium]